MRCSSLRPRHASSLCALLCSATTFLASAQTIGDYSRAQSALLERGMAQAIAQPLKDSARLPIEPVAPNRPSQSPPATSPRASPDGVEDSRVRQDVADVRVTGVFATRTKTTAEVTVDGVPYWLVEGDTVPHTSWYLRRVTADEVELDRKRSDSPRKPARDASAVRIVRLPRAN